MAIHYYLSVFPLEALIASQLEPEEFGSYMAVGARNGSYEQIIFVEVEEGYSEAFDWAYAKERCVPHPDGQPKHSVWMSVYRALEYTPQDVMKAMYLTTMDGRVLKLAKEDYSGPPQNRAFYTYLEICPIHPLVVSRLDPGEFAKYMTAPDNKVTVPRLVFADLKSIDFQHPENTGNIGRIYDRNLDHLRACVASVTDTRNKVNKNVERSVVESVSYGIIRDGIFVGDTDKLAFFPMPSIDELRRHHYDWARSAQIV